MQFILMEPQEGSINIVNIENVHFSQYHTYAILKYTENVTSETG